MFYLATDRIFVRDMFIIKAKWEAGKPDSQKGARDGCPACETSAVPIQ